MNDKELLELAAKAAGIPWPQNISGFQMQYDGARPWNPIHNDGDIARLEAALEIDVEWHENGVVARALMPNIMESRFYHEPFSQHGGDKNLARRYASTQAAAEIGRNMK